ncbi:MAG: hypothetical protein DMG87_18090 [Acidobacteria bacterium]|nr:MAG: hypothetical protein DMG87_18090 [Acidobacteriota bacterium]
MKYVYEEASATGPYTRPVGAYTRYGDVRPLLSSFDDRFVVFGSGDEVALDFDPSRLPPLPKGWVRDYFFVANGYEKDMDFYAAQGDVVEPLPFRGMGTYPYGAGKSTTTRVTCRGMNRVGIRSTIPSSAGVPAGCRAVLVARTGKLFVSCDGQAGRLPDSRQDAGATAKSF